MTESKNTANPLSLSFDPFVLTTGTFAPGQAYAYCAAVSDPQRAALGLAELSYYRGEIGAAAKQFAALYESENISTVTAAMLGSAIASFSYGDQTEILELYRRSRELRKQLEETSVFRRMADFMQLYFNILIQNDREISFPPVSVNAFSVPDSLKPMAFYCYARHLLSQGDVGRAIGMAEGANVFMKKPCPVSEIYLCLIIAIGYVMRGNWDKAEYYFRHAWKRSKPDGLLMPFAEHRGLLSGLLERCLRYEEPESYRRIVQLANTYHRGWVHVHNLLTGDCITDSLTAIEYNVATLVSKGLSNTQAAEVLGISVNSVRTHLRNIFTKLNITGRKELNKYVL